MHVVELQSQFIMAISQTNAVLMAALLAGNVLASTPTSSISPNDWSSLNQTLGGKFHVGHPAPLPCYLSPGDSKFNAAACADVVENKSNSTWIADQFGAFDNVQWASCMASHESCYVNGAVPLAGKCHQGMVSDYYIDATSAKDVQTGLAFVRKHGVNLVLRNSGHDYRGRSTGQNSLAIMQVSYMRIFHREPLS